MLQSESKSCSNLSKMKILKKCPYSLCAPTCRHTHTQSLPVLNEIPYCHPRLLACLEHRSELTQKSAYRMM